MTNTYRTYLTYGWALAQLSVSLYVLVAGQNDVCDLVSVSSLAWLYVLMYVRPRRAGVTVWVVWIVQLLLRVAIRERRLWRGTGYYSLPCLHTAWVAALAVVMPISYVFIPMITCACLTLGVSRPQDVFCGAILGIIIGGARMKSTPDMRIILGFVWYFLCIFLHENFSLWIILPLSAESVYFISHHLEKEKKRAENELNTKIVV